jgi:hypothetical protein
MLNYGGNSTANTQYFHHRNAYFALDGCDYLLLAAAIWQTATQLRLRRDTTWCSWRQNRSLSPKISEPGWKERDCLQRAGSAAAQQPAALSPQHVEHGRPVAMPSQQPGEAARTALCQYVSPTVPPSRTLLFSPPFPQRCDGLVLSSASVDCALHTAQPDGAPQPIAKLQGLGLPLIQMRATV